MSRAQKKIGGKKVEDFVDDSENWARFEICMRDMYVMKALDGKGDVL